MNTRLIHTLLAACAAFLLFVTTANAAVTSTIETGVPATPGFVDIQTKDVNGGFVSNAHIWITTPMTAAQKAVALAAGLNARYAADGTAFLFSAAAVAGTNQVIVTKAGGGGMTVTITADGTGESNNLISYPNWGNSTHWFWRAVRWLGGANAANVPAAGVMLSCDTDSPTGFAHEVVIADGVMNGFQLESQLCSQLVAHGLSFTVLHVIDPTLGEYYEFTSQDLPDSIPTLTPGKFTMMSAQGYGEVGAGNGIDVELVALGLSSCGSFTSPVQCPCGNMGQPGRGCNNSLNSGGAMLAASGSTTPDTVVLSVTGELASSFSIFLQGDQFNQAGTPFGDGSRCVGGNLKRIGQHSANNGVCDYPQGNDMSIRQKSASLGDTIQPGATRWYQVYYRDPAPSFCPAPTGSTYNISNAMAIQWM